MHSNKNKPQMAKVNRKEAKMKFSYEQKTDDLFIFNPKEKSKGSIEMGDIILDFNNKKELVGIQIMNASKFTVSKKVLSKLKECSFNIQKQKQWSIIRLKLLGEDILIEPLISVPLN